MKAILSLSGIVNCLLFHLFCTSGFAQEVNSRAYAVNSQGIACGAPVMIITSQGTGTGTFTDPQAAKAANSFKPYGVLYNWPAAMDGTASSNLNPSGIRGACPAGWHLPADPEWEQPALYISDTKGPYSHSNDDWADVATHLKSRSGWYSGMGQGNVLRSSGFKNGIRSGI